MHLQTQSRACWALLYSPECILDSIFLLSNEFKMVSGFHGPTCNLWLQLWGLKAQPSVPDEATEGRQTSGE